MTQARKFHLTVTADRTIRLPRDVPLGRVIVTVEPDPDAPAAATFVPQFEGDYRPGEGSWGPEVVIADDFDAPLPPDLQRYFDGDSDPEDLLD